MESLISIIDNHHRDLIEYDSMISSNHVSLEEIGRLSPEIFHCNDADYNFRFLNEKGCGWFCMAKDHIVNMGSVFIKKFYHPDMIKFELPKIKRFCRANNYDTVYSNYQQIFNPSIQDYSVCLVFIKKCSFLSGFISITKPMENDLIYSKKMNRLIGEEIFRNNHSRDFEKLTMREVEILKFLAKGLNNPQISDTLCISRRTVEQHRKNLNKKLNIHNYKDIISFAYAFDLV